MPRELNFNEMTGELLEEGFCMLYGEEELFIDEDDFINGYQIFTIN